MTSPGPGQPYQSFPDPTAHLPAPAPAPGPPKRTGVVVLTIVAVLLLGGTAAFGTLWFLERGDHDKTTEQLSTRDKELSDEKKAHDTAKTKLTDTEKAKADADAKVTSMTKCVEAGKELTRLAFANASEEEGAKAAEAVFLACGR